MLFTLESAYTTGYGYNQAGQLTQMTYPSSKVVKYGFDNRGRLNKVGDASVATKWVSSVGYQPSQQISSIGLGNGVTENYGYTADRLQLTTQTATKSGNTLMSLTYNYVAPKSRSGGVGTGQANTGQLMDITGTIKDYLGNTLQRNESYNYDQVSRVTQAGGFYVQRNYTYDRFGNRTAVSGGASQTVTLQQPGGGVTNNRIASVNSGPSYQYDAAGDVTFDAAHGFSYDAESRIVKVDSGSTATYFYDTANRRVKKLAGGFTTFYVWEGSSVIAEYSDAPAGSGGTRFYHSDRLSNRLITDSNGVVKGAMDNLPFGEDGGFVGESEKHRFTSYERDGEAGSHYAVNRQYSESTGRFNRPDPLLGDIGDPQSINRYGYVQNDPVNFVDPLGLVRTCSPSTVNPGCLVCTEDNGSLTVDCRPRDVLIPITRPRPIPPPDRPERPEKPERPDPRRAKKGFWDCYNKWKFSSLFENTPLHGVAEFLEVGLPVFPAGDAVAVAAKARRVGVGGTTERYASGLNWVFRRIFSGATLKAAIKVGSRATPPLAVAGTFTASYNATIAAQCLAGILE